MKTIVGIGGVIIVALVALLVFWSPTETIAPVTNSLSETQETQTAQNSVVQNGIYRVIADESTVRWAGKKPLIEGYINDGTIAVTEGSIVVVDQEAQGDFTIDMNTLVVSKTAKKPGKESALEGHLKGDGWFDVAKYPTASFTILEVKKQPDSDTTFVYDVRGDLTMKGQTHELSFPAKIYTDSTGLVHAEADFEFNRTTWGLTAGSASFIDTLADNAVDDMVALSFELVAEKSNRLREQ